MENLEDFKYRRYLKLRHFNKALKIKFYFIFSPPPLVTRSVTRPFGSTREGSAGVFSKKKHGKSKIFFER